MKERITGAMDAPFYSLRVERNAQGLSFTYRGPEGPSRDPFRHAFDVETVRSRADKIFSCLNPSTTTSIQEDLEDAAGRLADELLDSNLCDRLKRAEPGSYLVLELDHELAWIPWELIRDGQQFLCQRFCVARQLLKTQPELERAANRLLESHSGRGMLIAFGYTKGLPAAEESKAIKKELSGNLRAKSLKFTAEGLLNELKRDYDILHFVGHGEYKEGAGGQTSTGWRCTDRTLTRAHIESMSTATFPFLIFANACDSARTSIRSSETYVTDLYQTFLSNGVPHYIGTIAQVRSDASMFFARVFYRELVAGETIGKALWKARQEFLSTPGPPIWAYYVHYGDPKHRLVSKEHESNTIKSKIESSSTAQVMLEAFLRAQQVTDEQVRRQQSELDSLRARYAADGERRLELVRERVVGPVLGAVAQHFKDRVAELRSIRERLVGNDLRLLLVCGRGGIGKTALITKLLHDIQVDFTIRLDDAAYEVDSIVYVSLRQPEFRSTDGLIELISRTLQPELAAELRVKWRAKASLANKLEFLFHRIFCERRCLIVLDNFEDVMDKENRISDNFADLREFLEKCLEYDHGARVVATSRRTLVLSSPDLEGRVGCRRAELQLDAGLPETEAMALLRELDTDGRLGIKDASDEVLREVTSRCHGIPRTLETLVGTLRQRRTWTLLRMLDDAAAFSSLVDNPARELYDNLSPEERLVIQALAVYDCPVPAAAVRHLLPGLSVDEILDDLVRNYVVDYEQDRFSLHSLDRQYAYRQLPDRDGSYAKPALHASAGQFFHELRKPHWEWKNTDDLKAHLQECHHLLRAGLYDRAASLLEDIDYFVEKWGYYAPIVELRSQLNDRLTDSAQQETNWRRLGWSLSRLGEVQQASDFYECALASARKRGDKSAMAASLLYLGLFYDDLMEKRRSIEHLEQSLGIAGEIKHGPIEAIALSSLGARYAELGEIQKGADYCGRAVAIAEEFTGWCRGRCLYNLAHIFVARGWMDKALKTYFIAFGTLSRADRCTGGMCLGSIAAIFYSGEHSYSGTLSRKFEESILFYQQALEIARAIGHKLGVALHLRGLGYTYHCHGVLADARSYYKEALELAMPVTDYSCNVNLGIVCLEEDKREEAQGHFAYAISRCRELLEKTPRFYEVIYALALAYIGSGQVGEAISTYRQATEVCSAKGVLQSALRNVRLLERCSKPVVGLSEIVELLQGTIDKDLLLLKERSKGALI